MQRTINSECIRYFSYRGRLCPQYFEILEKDEVESFSPSDSNGPFVETFAADFQFRTLRELRYHAKSGFTGIWGRKHLDSRYIFGQAIHSWSGCIAA